MSQYCHSLAQKKNEDGVWVTVIVDPFPVQNYSFFAWLGCEHRNRAKLTELLKPERYRSSEDYPDEDDDEEQLNRGFPMYYSEELDSEYNLVVPVLPLVTFDYSATFENRDASNYSCDELMQLTGLTLHQVQRLDSLPEGVPGKISTYGDEFGPTWANMVLHLKESGAERIIFYYN